MAKKEKETKETTKETRYRKKRGGILYTVVAVILIAASVVAACTVFFQVETVTVEGNERYTQEEILSVASVEMGANMILTPGEQIAQRIYGELPYVDRVDVQKRFPTTLKLEITECQPVAVLTGAASAWVIDAKGKLLEEADEAMAQEYATVTGLELLEPKQGELAKTTPENEKQLQNLTTFTQALVEYGMMDQVTSIDVSSRTEIVMVYDGRLTVKLLSSTDYDGKLRALKTIVAMAGEDGRGTVNMKGKDRVIWSKEG